MHDYNIVEEASCVLELFVLNSSRHLSTLIAVTGYFTELSWKHSLSASPYCRSWIIFIDCSTSKFYPHRLHLTNTCRGWTCIIIENIYPYYAQNTSYFEIRYISCNGLCDKTTGRSIWCWYCNFEWKKKVLLQDAILFDADLTCGFLFEIGAIRQRVRLN